MSQLDKNLDKMKNKHENLLTLKKNISLQSGWNVFNEELEGWWISYSILYSYIYII